MKITSRNFTIRRNNILLCCVSARKKFWLTLIRTSINNRLGNYAYSHNLIGVEIIGIKLWRKLKFAIFLQKVYLFTLSRWNLLGAIRLKSGSSETRRQLGETKLLLHENGNAFNVFKLNKKLSDKSSVKHTLWEISLQLIFVFIIYVC